MHIDWWTLALQTVNFLILIWLLSRFFYRPITHILAERRATAQKMLDEAKEAGMEVASELAKIKSAQDGFAAERASILAQARADGEAERNALLEKARVDADGKRAQVDAMIARERSEMEKKLASRVEELAVTIAARLVERLPSQAESQMFLDGLCEKIRTLPPNSKSTLSSASGIDVTTAAPLEPAEQDNLRKRIEAAMGSALALSFHTDKNLIAGIELSSADIVLRNNWREDLRRLKEELTRDGTP